MPEKLYNWARYCDAQPGLLQFGGPLSTDYGPLTYFCPMSLNFYVISTQMCMKFILLINEPRHEKNGILHMRKQRRRSPLW